VLHLSTPLTKRHPQRLLPAYFKGMVDKTSPPGWYSDPAKPDRVRWWSGNDWTEETKPAIKGSWKADDYTGNFLSVSRDEEGKFSPLLTAFVGLVLGGCVYAALSLLGFVFVDHYLTSDCGVCTERNNDWIFDFLPKCILVGSLLGSLIGATINYKTVRHLTVALFILGMMVVIFMMQSVS
jgi:hypothetical protein